MVTIVLYPASSQKQYAKSSYALTIAINIKQSIHTAKCPHVDLSWGPLDSWKALPTENPSKKITSYPLPSFLCTVTKLLCWIQTTVANACWR